eukprot:INCI6183.9.p1 GENE.INCI6183.9~~INCI6183.9.p1  ORF type:complete len:108 (+),score=18.19 INCI6183.9:192-515(+)
MLDTEEEDQEEEEEEEEKGRRREQQAEGKGSDGGAVPKFAHHIPKDSFVVPSVFVSSLPFFLHPSHPTFHPSPAPEPRLDFLNNSTSVSGVGVVGCSEQIDHYFQST